MSGTLQPASVFPLDFEGVAAKLKSRTAKHIGLRTHDQENQSVVG